MSLASAVKKGLSEQEFAPAPLATQPKKSLGRRVAGGINTAVDTGLNTLSNFVPGGKALKAAGDQALMGQGPSGEGSEYARLAQLANPMAGLAGGAAKMMGYGETPKQAAPGVQGQQPDLQTMQAAAQGNPQAMKLIKQYGPDVLDAVAQMASQYTQKRANTQDAHAQARAARPAPAVSAGKEVAGFGKGLGAAGYGQGPSALKGKAGSPQVLRPAPKPAAINYDKGAPGNRGIPLGSAGPLSPQTSSPPFAQAAVAQGQATGALPQQPHQGDTPEQRLPPTSAPTEPIPLSRLKFHERSGPEPESWRNAPSYEAPAKQVQKTLPRGRRVKSPEIPAKQVKKTLSSRVKSPPVKNK